MPPRAEVPPPNDDAGANDPTQELPGEDMSVEDQVSGLLALMQDHPNDVNLVGMSLSHLVALSQQHRGLVMATNTVAQVFGIMQNHGDNENIMEGCLFFLVGAQASEMTEHRVTPLIHQAEQVVSIVTVMNRFRENEAIQQNGLLVLSPLGQEDTTRNLLLVKDAISAIVFAMAKLPNNTEVQFSGCCSIFELLENDTDGDVKEQVEKAGGIPVLLKIMKRNGGHPISGHVSIEAYVLKCACGSISLLSRDSDSAKGAIVDLGGINILLAFIKNQTLNTEFFREAFEILHRLGKRSGAAEALVNAGGVSILTSLMKEDLDNQVVAAGVIMAFLGLATNSQVMADALALEGGLEAIVKAMSRHVDNVHLQVFALATFSDCAATEDTCHVKDVIRSIPGIIRCVVATMCKHADCLDIQALGCNVLNDLTFSVKTCVDTVRTGGLVVLGRAMNKFIESHHLQTFAIGVFRNIAEGAVVAKSNNLDLPVDLIKSMKISGAVHHIVDALCRNSDNEAVVQNFLSCLLALAGNDDGIKKEIVSVGGIEILTSVQAKSKGDTAEQATLLLNCLEDSKNENTHHDTGSFVSKKPDY